MQETLIDSSYHKLDTKYFRFEKSAKSVITLKNVQKIVFIDLCQNLINSASVAMVRPWGILMKQTAKEPKYSPTLSSKHNLAVGYNKCDYNIAQQ